MTDDEDDESSYSVEFHPSYTQSVAEVMIDIGLNRGYEAAQVFNASIKQAEDEIIRNPMSGRSAKEVGRSRSVYAREKLCCYSKGKYLGSIGYEFRNDGIVRLIGFNLNAKQYISY